RQSIAATTAEDSPADGESRGGLGRRDLSDSSTAYRAKPKAARIGGRRSDHGLMVIVNCCGALVSTPPLAVPPLSWAVTVTCTTVPPANGLGVNVSVPDPSIAGWTSNAPGLSFDTWNDTV